MKRVLLMSAVAMCCAIAPAKTNELFTVENGKIGSFCGYRFGELKSGEEPLYYVKKEVKGLPNWGKCHVQFKHLVDESKSPEKTVMYRAYFSRFIENGDDTSKRIRQLVKDAGDTITNIIAKNNMKFKYTTDDHSKNVLAKWEFENGYIMVNGYNIKGFGWETRVEAADTSIASKFALFKRGMSLDYPCTEKLFVVKDGRLVSFLGHEFGELMPKGAQFEMERRLWGEGYIKRQVEMPVSLPRFRDRVLLKYSFFDDKLLHVIIDTHFDKNDEKEYIDIGREAYRGITRAIADNNCDEAIEPITMTGGFRWKFAGQDIYLALLEKENGKNVRVVKIYAGQLGFESDKNDK